jgi:hypothetical protein
LHMYSMLDMHNFVSACKSNFFYSASDNLIEVG